MAGELVRAAARLTGVPVMPGGVVANVAEHLRASSSSRIPVSALAPLTSGGEAAGVPMARVVFDGVPTHQEAQEATSELADAIERMYLASHGSDGNERSIITRQESDSSLSNPQVGQAEARGSGEITTESAASRAFRLLREPIVQDVIRSLAVDPNMYEAVRSNQEFQEFLGRYHGRQSSLASVARGAERLDMLPPYRIEYSSNDAEHQPDISFEDLFRIIQGMVDMMKSIFDLVKNLFRGEGANSSANGDHGTDPGANENEFVIEKSILGLVIMVLMLILLKRR